MSETLADLGQRYFAGLWDAAGGLGLGDGVDRRVVLLEMAAEVEAQIAGFRLHVLYDAKLSADDAVVEHVRESVRTTPGQAVAALRLADDLGERFELIGAALSEGRASLAQVEAIVAGLKKLPARFTRVDLVRAQEVILDHVDTLGPAELRVLASQLTYLLDPAAAEDDEARRLARQDMEAHRDRSLRLSPDHHGSMRISGQIPMAEAALLSAQLDALTPPASSYRDTGETPSRDARRADALVALTKAAADTGQLPAHGGDRPHVHVTVDLETLTSGLGRAELLVGGAVENISAGEARRLACDADIIPVVLGGASRPLDVGRSQRLFTPAIRTALVLRDQGCAFPGCATGPTACDGHHIITWYAGGDSSVKNGVLLCPHHHRLVEPDPQQSEESQWRVHLDEGTGLPWFTPPRHVDPRQRPRQHTRYRLRQLELRPSAGAPPCPDEEQPKSREDLMRELDDLIRHSASIWAPPEAGPDA